MTARHPMLRPAWWVLSAFQATALGCIYAVLWVKTRHPVPGMLLCALGFPPTLAIFARIGRMVREDRALYEAGQRRRRTS